MRPSWELRALTDQLCATAGFTPRVAFEADDLAVVRGFVATGLGVTLLPLTDAEAVSPETGAVRVLRLSGPGAHRVVGLAWSRGRRMLPSADLFRRSALDRSTRRRLSP